MIGYPPGRDGAGVPPAIPVMDGLVAWLPFYAGPGAQHDASGNQNHVYPTGGTPAFDPTYPGGAHSFATGGVYFIGTGDSPVKTGVVTVATWIKPNVLTRGDAVSIWKFGSSSTDQFDLLWGLTSGKPEFYINVGSVTSSGASSIAMAVGRWYHVVGVFDGSNVAVYVNGVLGASAAAGGALASGVGNPLEIGSSTAGANGCNASLADVRLYNRALKPAEINALYNFGLAREAGFVVGEQPGNIAAAGLQPVTDQRPQRRSRIVDSVSFVAVVAAAAAVPSMDSWAQPTSQPRRQVDTLPTQTTSFVPLDVARLDTWVQPTNQPRRPARSHAGEQYLAWVQAAPFPESVTVDRWQQQTLPPRRPVIQIVQSFDWVPVVASVVAPSMDTWSGPTSQPRSQFRSQDGQQSFAFGSPTVPAFDSWFVPTEQPRLGLHLSSRQADQTASFVQVVAAAVAPSMDSWFVLSSQPSTSVRSSQQRASQHYGFFAYLDNNTGGAAPVDPGSSSTGGFGGSGGGGGGWKKHKSEIHRLADMRNKRKRRTDEFEDNLRAREAALEASLKAAYERTTEASPEAAEAVLAPVVAPYKLADEQVDWSAVMADLRNAERVVAAMQEAERIQREEDEDDDMALKFILDAI